MTLDTAADTIGADGGTSVSAAKKIPTCVGIVSAPLPISDTALGTTPTMGLGVVYSAEAIRAVVQLFPK